MKSILTSLVLLICFQVFSQNLVSFSLRESRTKEQLNQSLGTGLPPAEYGLDMYKVLYTMYDVHGNLDTASGALYIPIYDDEQVFSLICDMHGTTDRTWYPSDYFSGTTALLTVDGGFVTYAPDYLGLGTSRGFHPYIHAESQAMAGIEMHRAVLEVLDVLQVNHDNRLFITGYSQGGHAAMAMHRLIQNEFSDEFNVVAASPMSGPYSLKDIMFDRMIDDLPYTAGAAFLPYVVLSFQEVYGNLYTTLGDIFKPLYVPPIQNFRNGTVSLQGMATQLVAFLAIFTGNVNPRDMIRDDVLAILLNDPESHPIFQAVADNDLLNWIPEVPVRMYHCTADEQVPYINSIVAREYFLAGGATDVEAESKGNLDHAGCGAPATLASRIFFKSFITTSTSQVDKHTFSVYPNPVSGDQIFISSDFTLDRNLTVTIYSHDGLLRARYNSVSSTVNVSQLTSGMYVMQISDDLQNIHTLRFVKI